MKIPTLFVPENKDLDKKLENIIKEKPDKMQIHDINSLADLPDVMGEHVQRTPPEKIQKKDWGKYFGDRIPQYLTQAIELTYIEPSSIFFTCIRILKLKSKTPDDANKALNLTELNYDCSPLKTVNLKKDDYLVTIGKNILDKGDSLEVIGNYYRENFGMEEL